MFALSEGGKPADRRVLRAPSLVGSRTVDKAAIFNKEGSAVWATSKDFSVRKRTPAPRPESHLCTFGGIVRKTYP